MRFLILLLLLLLPLLSLTARAAAPELEGFFPTGAQPGSTNLVTAAGKSDPWPPHVWVNEPGLQFTATTNKGKFEVQIDPTAAPGPRLIRFHNKDGASEPAFFIVASGGETNEVEPNDHYTNAQVIAQSSLAVNGQLNKRDDVDCFAVSLKSGQTLQAHLESYTLMAKVDAAMRLLTPRGEQLTWNHDFATFDPRITWTATNDERVIVQLFGFPYPATSEIRLAGGDGAHYRLHLKVVDTKIPASLGPLTTTNTLLTLPSGTAHGVIARAEQEDTFRLLVKKDQWIGAEVRAKSIGSPLDAWLQIKGPDGKELTRNDDANGSADPEVEWKSTLDAEITFAIGSLTSRGDPEFSYELHVRELRPDFRATLEKSSLAIKPNETNKFEVKLERLRGHTNALELKVSDLPEGITVTISEIPAKNGTINVTLISSENTAPFQGAITIKLRETSGSAEKLVPFSLVSRTENNGVPAGYQTLVIPEAPHLWLTVLPKPEAVAAAK